MFRTWSELQVFYAVGGSASGGSFAPIPQGYEDFAQEFKNLFITAWIGAFPLIFFSYYKSPLCSIYRGFILK
jgi:hypothetical protein